VTSNRTPHRAGDPEGITIDRKIPLWGVACMGAALVGQAILMWNGQNMQAQEMRHQSEQIQDLAQQVKAMASQLATKDGTDIGQNLRIDELNRRVVILETAKVGKP
jgi:hypothetical protein